MCVIHKIREDLESYWKVVSEEDISGRLAKMDSISSRELSKVVNALRNKKRAGYQEGLIEELIGDIKVSMNSLLID